MKTKPILLILLIAGLFVLSLPACKKENNSHNDTPIGGNLLIDSLHASKRVITAYIDTSFITVHTKDDDVKISWISNYGVLLEAGSSTFVYDSLGIQILDCETVYYTACNPCTGLNTITCTVEKGDVIETDTIQVRVKSYDL